MADRVLGLQAHSTHSRRSLRSAVLAAGLRVTAKPALLAWSLEPSVRWPARALDVIGERMPLPSGSRVERVALPRCNGEWVRGRGARDGSAVLYLHGGALLTCSPATHRALACDVSRVCGAPALVVDFRLMPVATVEDMVRDCLEGYRWLLARGLRGRRIVVAGDSAGCFLAFLMAMSVRDDDLPAPAALACMSPLLDLGVARKSASAHHRHCDIFTLRACRALARYTAEVDLAHGVTRPRVSPIDADLHGLPPVLLQIGSREILRPDAEEMAGRLAAAGVPCELQVWEGQVHVFQAAAALLPEARSALLSLGDFARRELGRRPPSRRAASARDGVGRQRPHGTGLPRP